MIVADYTLGTTRLATREEIAEHVVGAGLRIARDRGRAPPTEQIELEPRLPASADGSRCPQKPREPMGAKVVDFCGVAVKATPA